MKQSIVAFDPGKTTGWATLSLGESSEVTSGQTSSIYEVAYFCAPPTTHIVCETYNMRMKYGNAADPLKVIGVLEYLAGSPKVDIPIHWQTPAQAKGFWTDDKLKMVGLYHHGPHARDAIRHLLYYVSFTLQHSLFLKELEIESPNEDEVQVLR